MGNCKEFGKAGRADTAIDLAPLTMQENTIHFKHKQQWRPGRTMDKLVRKLDNAVSLLGIVTVWVLPGFTSALAERLKGGRYIDVDIDRALWRNGADAAVPGRRRKHRPNHQRARMLSH